MIEAEIKKALKVFKGKSPTATAETLRCEWLKNYINKFNDFRSELKRLSLKDFVRSVKPHLKLISHDQKLNNAFDNTEKKWPKLIRETSSSHKNSLHQVFAIMGLKRYSHLGLLFEMEAISGHFMMFWDTALNSFLYMF